MQKQKDVIEHIAKWEPHRKEWLPDPQKPFLVQVLKKAVFLNMVDLEFLTYFKNSFSIMCEAWLKRKGIDPMINTSQNYYILQNEFFKVLAHINRGFELEVNANWESGVGILIKLWKSIQKEKHPQWIDHKKNRQKNNPVSRYELQEDPRQDEADGFWVNIFRKGIKRKNSMLEAAKKTDAQQAQFFILFLTMDEHKTFTETKTNLINNTQDEWTAATLSSKLGLKIGYDFLEETFAPSLLKLNEADKIITEDNAKVWLIKNFFHLDKREWRYLLETLTGGHDALERLFGSLIVTLVLGHDRKSFELKEDDAEEFFKIFWKNSLKLPLESAETVLRSLHQSVIAGEEYKIYLEAATILHALTISKANNKRYKTYQEAKTVLEALDASVENVINHPINEANVKLTNLTYPIDTEKGYLQLLLKLKLLLKLEMEIHAVVEKIFWKVTEAFSDLITAYKIQKKQRVSDKQKQELNLIAKKYHFRPDENNFLMYAPDRCYIGQELGNFFELKKPDRKRSIKLNFEKSTQKVKANYITPPPHICKKLTIYCGQYGKLTANICEKEAKRTFPNVKMTWTLSRLQVTDIRYKAGIKPLTHYEIKITRAEPRKPREKWE
ncbi:MAG: hypothetical protein J7M06_01295 [Proteobacteria bacterium]|nr:hypothetical protein [Pseudomonadota bacterium]